MRRRKAVGILGVLLLVFLISGCQTVPTPVNFAVDPRIPLTVSIMDQLAVIIDGGDITNFQLLLFGRISLEREFTVDVTSRDAGGRAMFMTEHVREIITINDQTYGQVVQWYENGNEVRLLVSFDSVGSHTLTFSGQRNDPDEFFRLSYNPGGLFLLAGYERGTIDFGGYMYRLRYQGYIRPYLMIRIAHGSIDRLYTLTMPGRLVY